MEENGCVRTWGPLATTRTLLQHVAMVAWNWKTLALGRHAEIVEGTSPGRDTAAVRRRHAAISAWFLASMNVFGHHTPLTRWADGCMYMIPDAA